MSTTDSASNNFSGMFASIGGVAANYLQDKMLKKMDGDGNGSVNGSEFKAALEQVGSKLGMDTGDSSTADAMFGSVDANGDGELIGSEVGQMLKNMFAPQGSTDAFVQSRGDEQRFTELDADGDGNISMAEFGINAEGTEAQSAAAASTDLATEEMPTATASLDSAALKTLMGQVDGDSDGQISGQELTTFVTQLSSQLQAATASYNSAAMSSLTTSKLNAAA